MTALPLIRRARTVDGLDIAYHVTGKGPPLMLLFPYHVNHLRLNWNVGLHRRGIEALAKQFTVINLDHRGAGLSSSQIKRLSWSDLALDIDAVLQAQAIDRVALCTMGPAMMTACAFASSVPHRISSIVAISAGESKVNRDVLRLRYQNPRLEALVRGVLVSGPDNKEDAVALASVSMAALQPSVFDLWARLLSKSRVASMAASVVAPVLFLHAAEDELIPPSSGYSLARRMRNARLIEVPVGSPMQVWRDADALGEMASFVMQGFGLRIRKKSFKPKRQRQGQWPQGLTDREVEVLRMVASGSKNKEIAKRLNISKDTVSHHLRNIFKKASLANRTEAAIFAYRHGLSGG